MTLNDRKWHRQNGSGSYLISTDIHLLDLDFINDAFDTKDMFWARRLPRDQLELAIKQSITVALYEVLPQQASPATAGEPSSPREESPTVAEPPEGQLKQIGLGRLVTDHVTFAYLSDVYIAPEKRGLGLFRWLIDCTRELLDAHPALRRAVLFTGDPGLKAYYEKALGVWDVREKEPKVIMMSRKGFKS